MTCTRFIVPLARFIVPLVRFIVPLVRFIVPLARFIVSLTRFYIIKIHTILIIYNKNYLNSIFAGSNPLKLVADAQLYAPKFSNSIVSPILYSDNSHSILSNESHV